MAIEKVKRTWFLVERGRLDQMIEALAGSRTVHIIDLKEQAAPTDLAPDPDRNPNPNRSPNPSLTPGAPTGLDAAVENADKLSRALDILDGFVPPKRRFHENFVNLPAEMERSEFDRHVAAVDVADLQARTDRIQRDHAEAEKKAEELTARLAALADWAGADAPPAGLARCGAELGTVPAKTLPGLIEAAAESESVALEPGAVKGARALVAAVWLNDARDEATQLLRAHGFRSLALDPGAGGVRDVIAKTEAALEAAQERVRRLTEEARALAAERRAVVAALAHWQAEAERHSASAKTLASKRIATLSGYVRVREMPKLEKLIAAEFPSVSLIADDPTPDEDVPVSLGGSRLWAPAQFLTSMFGLPNYFEFDPSPFIFLTFLVFFGCCFGDVVYGLMLMATGWWLARKAADHPSLARFFGLLTWCGLSAAVVGVLTGSWAADLASGGYLGERAEGFVTNLMIVDPLKKTVLVLGLVLGIGMLNQFYGMALLLYRQWRRGRRLAGLCDGGLWLIFLPGLVLLLVGGAGVLPPVWTKVALGMVVTAGLGLVLTQGRHEKGFFAKAVTGVVSLYGILGTYGTTSFIGDTLSYSRLLALGLTTVIVGMSFNIIAAVVPNVLVQLVLAGSQILPFLGGPIKFVAGFLELPLFALLISVVIGVCGHAFNFLISTLGGFVHSARLIFVEFFTKFYQGGATPFAPLGSPRTVRVIEKE